MDRKAFSDSYRKAAAAFASSTRARGLNAAGASKLASKIAALADSQLPQLRVDGFPLDCGPGCCDCCYQMVFATIPEVTRYAEMIASWTNERRLTLLGRLQEYAETVKEGASEFYLRTRAACPFLEEGLCSIYTERPIVCRGLASTDVNICKNFRENPAAGNDFGPNEETEFVLALAGGVVDGLYNGQGDALVPLPLELLKIISGRTHPEELLSAGKSGEPTVRPWHIRFSPPVDDNLGLPPANAAYNQLLAQWGKVPGRQLLELFDERTTSSALGRIFTPLSYNSADEVAEWREHFEQSIDQLRNFEPWDPIEAYHTLPNMRPIGAAYQPYSMKPVMERLGQVFHDRIAARIAPDLLEPMPSRKPGKIRVGLAGSVLDSSGTNWTLGWIANFNREDFEVTVLKVSGSEDPMSLTFKDAADHYYRLAGHPLEIARFIRSLDLDYLLFPDIGDLGVLYQLAIFRLARSQAAGWGCPHTTGLPTIDDYLSSEFMEPDGADEDYTETLVKLPNLGITLRRPPDIEVRRDRGDFHLPEGFLVSFPQMLMKWLPQWDEVLAEISNRTGSPIVLIDTGYGHQRETFAERMKTVGANVTWIPKMRPIVFRRFVQLCDVALDSPDWSGGLTAMNSLLMGTPFVNLPGRFLRHRLAKAFCEIAGVPGLVAKDIEDYVDLATSQERLASAMANLNVDRMFNDMAPLRALETHIATRVMADS